MLDKEQVFELYPNAIQIPESKYYLILVNGIYEVFSAKSNKILKDTCRLWNQGNSKSLNRVYGITFDRSVGIVQEKIRLAQIIKICGIDQIQKANRRQNGKRKKTL